MRQVPIEKFKRDMKSEIKDLPFIVTKRGKVLFVANHVVEAEKGNKRPESVNHVVEDVEAQLTDIVTRRQRVATVKSTIPTGEIPILGHSKSMQTRKKGK